MKQITVPVDVAGQPYEVLIGDAVARLTGQIIEPFTKAEKVALITDSNVAEHHGVLISASLSFAGYQVLDMSIDPGEKSKTWGNAGRLLDELAKWGVGRNDLVLSLGGGVVGDLAGFVAATYLRGIDFVQVPTTLLAMVDSSVGGKTGVNLRSGKNLAGAFKQPVHVIADTGLLKTLPEAEWRSGLAELAKSAILSGEDFLSWLEAHAEGLTKRRDDLVIEAVRRSVEFKASVVARDEKEAGPRECLNYGHTFGHAAEKVAGYGVYTHGAAVAEGIRFASRLAVETVGADIAFVQRQDALLDALGIESIAGRLRPSELFSAMHADKKARNGEVRFVLAKEPAEWSCEVVPDTTVLAHLEAWADSRKKR